MAVSYLAGRRQGSVALGHTISALVLLVLASAQSTWPAWFRLQGQPPDLVLIAVLTLGLTAGAMPGLVAGFLGAFIWAAISGVPMGHLFIAYMGLGFVAGSMRGRMFSDRLSLAVIIVAAGVFVASVISLMLAPPPSPQSWVAAVLARAVYSAALTIPIYPLTRYLAHYYPEPDEL